MKQTTPQASINIVHESATLPRAKSQPRQKGLIYASISSAIHSAWFDAVRQKIRVEILEEDPGAFLDYTIKVFPG